MMTLENLTATDRATALFASRLPAGVPVAPATLHAAITEALHDHGGPPGCAGQMAAVYGENPAYATARMRWALAVLRAPTRS
ncbi:hypothetical protein Q0Z83_023120 [Actinoplanes sichuanensis]|uniref:Uncharacterized protein n=1 Tax=Actinoplanes sichuanensis TaxID=512349 RepID=A0ABW4A298_9ACTN|nr:hypothetical protein [Actinoplanes sichuanensis]BEL04121.1 hypothetical protein Q0Z83_023120 [Actinoplanes sichuanensis]